MTRHDWRMVSDPSSGIDEDVVAEWLREELRAHTIRRIGPIPGSSTASVSSWEVQDWRGVAMAIVVKRYDRVVVGHEAVALVRSEERGLLAAEQCALDAPRSVCADPEGAHTGAPSLAMTRMDGVAKAVGGREWILGLANALGAIARVARPTIALPPMESWREPLDDCPTWLGDQGLWRALQQRMAVALVGSAPQFVHRDFHPLNVLWDGGAVRGVVDWANACIGPIELDVSRCRVNIALTSGIDAADSFLGACSPFVNGYDRAWDLETIASFLGNPDVVLAGNAYGAGMTSGGVRQVLREMVSFALRA